MMKENIEFYQRFLVVENNKYGFKNGYGELVIPCIFEDVKRVRTLGNPFIIECFEDGFAKVKYNGKWGFIDVNGKWYDEIN